jgi:serine protease AprX
VNKDNAYGYGLPAMGSMLGQVAQVNTSQGGTEMFPIIMMMSLMAGLMGGA